MVRPRITTLTGLTRQLLSSSTAAGREIKLSPLPSSSSPSPLLSVQAPPRSSYRLPLTGTDSRKNRPTLSVRDVLAQVALKRREEAVKNRRPVPPVSLPGKVLPAAEHPIELPPRRSTRPGILKKSDQPQKARARHVSFGETSVKIVDRWIKSDDPAPIKPTPRPLAGPSILKKSGNPRKASARHVSFGEKSVQVVSRWIKPEDRDPVSEPSPISTPPPPPAPVPVPRPISPPPPRSAPDSAVASAPPASPPPVVNEPVAPTPHPAREKTSEEGTSRFPWGIAIGCAVGYVYVRLLLNRFGF